MEVHYQQGIRLGHSFKKVKIYGYIEDIPDIV